MTQAGAAAFQTATFNRATFSPNLRPREAAPQGGGAALGPPPRLMAEIWRPVRSNTEESARYLAFDRVCDTLSGQFAGRPEYGPRGAI